MNIEARKLKLIERFMKFQDESDIIQLDKALSEIEIQIRAKASEKDILEGKTRTYERFSKDVKTWLQHRKNTKS